MITGRQGEWFYLQTWRRKMEEQEKNEKWIKEISRLVQHYQMMEANVPGSSMIREARWQYLEMASGGSGGDLGFEENGETTCRAINYPGYPNWVFQSVIDQMGWSRD